MNSSLPSPTPPSSHPAARWAPAAVATAVLVLAPAAVASAHVRVHPDSTAAGSYAALTFRVPTESATASTTAVSVRLPTATPFTSVSVKPVPGWTATVTDADLPRPVDVDGAKITRAPSVVTWTAAPGAAITPGEYQEFPISVGPLPTAGTEVLLPAAQTYSDGSVVAWDQKTPASGKEPEHPAPAVTTTAGADRGAGGDAAPASGSGGSRASWLGGGGLALGAVALVVALVRGRRPSAARA